jgi:hypothetical protein
VGTSFKLLVVDLADLKAKTIQDFGEQWTAFRDNPAHYGSVDLLADLFGPLLSQTHGPSCRAAYRALKPGGRFLSGFMGARAMRGTCG